MIDKSVITKELVNEVLQWDEPISRIEIIGSYIRIFIEGRHNIPEQNIYEFAHKCKEWAASLGFNVSSNLVTTMITSDKHRELFQADTEPEAIFKACQWILKENK